MFHAFDYRILFDSSFSYKRKRLAYQCLINLLSIESITRTSIGIFKREENDKVVVNTSNTLGNAMRSFIHVSDNFNTQRFNWTRYNKRFTNLVKFLESSLRIILPQVRGGGRNKCAIWSGKLLELCALNTDHILLEAERLSSESALMRERWIEVQPNAENCLVVRHVTQLIWFMI